MFNSEKKKKNVQIVTLIREAWESLDYFKSVEKLPVYCSTAEEFPHTHPCLTCLTEGYPRFQLVIQMSSIFIEMFW